MIPYPDDPFVLTVVELLLKYGAAKYIDGHPEEDSPLCCAAMLGALELTRILLKYDANADRLSPQNRPHESRRYPLLTLATKQKRLKSKKSTIGNL